MSWATEAAVVDCPYCGERFETTVDCSVEEQSYIEDCQVCCAPITFVVTIAEDGRPQVLTRGEDEA